MSGRTKAVPVPEPQPKGKAQNRARQAMAHVVTQGKGVTRFEVDGTQMAVETPAGTDSVEFATQVEEPSGRKVKVMGQITFSNPWNPNCKGSSRRPCNGLHDAKGGPPCPSCQQSGGSSRLGPYPQSEVSDWVQTKQHNGGKRGDSDPGPPPKVGVTSERTYTDEEWASQDQPGSSSAGPEEPGQPGGQAPGPRPRLRHGRAEFRRVEQAAPVRVAARRVDMAGIRVALPLSLKFVIPRRGSTQAAVRPQERDPGCQVAVSKSADGPRGLLWIVVQVSPIIFMGEPRIGSEPAELGLRRREEAERLTSLRRSTEHVGYRAKRARDVEFAAGSEHVAKS